MFTAVNGIFGLSVEGSVAEEIIENAGDGVKAITIHTYSGEDYRLDCDDSLLTSVKEVTYDTCEEDVYKHGITEYYELDESKDLESCQIVKLKGICFDVVRFEGLILLNNKRSKGVDYKCKIEEFKELLESVDEHYEIYRKEYSDL